MNLDELLNAKPQRTNQCKWSVWYNTQLMDVEREAIERAFKSDMETSHIARALREYGCPMSDSTIRTHRRRECKTCNG